MISDMREHTAFAGGHQRAILVVCCIVFLGVEAAALIGGNAVMALTLAALTGFLVLSLARAELALVVWLTVLALGTDTLDATSSLTTVPLVRSVLTVVPTASITVSDALMGVLILSLVVRSVLARQALHQAIGDSAITLPLLAYLAVVLLTTTLASFVVPFARLKWSGLYFLRLVSTVAPYFVVVALRPSQRWLQRYALLYVALAIIPMTRTIVQGWDPVTMSFRDFFGRVSAGGFSAMGLGTYLGVVVGMCGAVAGAELPGSRHWRLGSWAMLLGSAFAVISAQKRTAFVGLVIILIALALLPRAGRRRWGLIVALTVLLVAGVVGSGIVRHTLLPSSNVSQQSFAGLLRGYTLDESLTQRFALWYGALQAALRYPLGVGFRTMAIGPFGHPHNQLLQVAAESSIAGLVCFVWLMLAILKRSLHLWRTSDRLSIALGGGVFCGFAGMLAQGIFEESFHNWDAMALLWLLAGLAAVQLAGKRPKPHLDVPPPSPLSLEGKA